MIRPYVFQTWPQLARFFSVTLQSLQPKTRVSSNWTNSSWKKQSLLLNKKGVRSLTSTIQPCFPLCSELPSEYNDATCYGCQEKSPKTVLEETLWLETGITKQCSPSPTNSPSSPYTTDASFFFQLSLSLLVENTKLHLYHHTPACSPLLSQKNFSRNTELLSFVLSRPSLM